MSKLVRAIRRPKPRSRRNVRPEINKLMDEYLLRLGMRPFVVMGLYE